MLIQDQLRQERNPDEKNGEISWRYRNNAMLNLTVREGKRERESAVCIHPGRDRVCFLYERLDETETRGGARFFKIYFLPVNHER